MHAPQHLSQSASAALLSYCPQQTSKAELAGLQSAENHQHHDTCLPANPLTGFSQIHSYKGNRLHHVRLKGMCET